jgi:hypothetical protein
MIVNWQLAKHPMNYLIITLMLVLAGIAGHLVLSLLGYAPVEAVSSDIPNQLTPSTTPVNLRDDGTFQAISVGQ